MVDEFHGLKFGFDRAAFKFAVEASLAFELPFPFPKNTDLRFCILDILLTFLSAVFRSGGSFSMISSKVVAAFDLTVSAMELADLEASDLIVVTFDRLDMGVPDLAPVPDLTLFSFLKELNIVRGKEDSGGHLESRFVVVVSCSCGGGGAGAGCGCCVTRK